MSRSQVVLRPQNIPELLKRLDHWLIWRYEDNPKPGAKPLKVPYYANGSKRYGALGSEKDIERLTSFKTAVKAARSRKFDGIGLAVLPQQNITILDLDNCIDSQGSVSEFGQIVLETGTYVERSPSGQGLRAVYMGAIAPNEKRNFHLENGERVEVYCGQAYTTFTGDAVIDKDEPMRDTSKVLHMPATVKRELERGMQGAYGNRKKKSSESIDGVMSLNAIELPNFTLEQARAILRKLPEKWGRPGEGTWYRVAAALHMQFDGSEEAYEVLNEWSQSLEGYDEESNRRRWDAGFSHAKGKDDLTSVRNLIYEALQNGCKIRDKTMEAWGLKRPRKQTGVDDEEAEAEAAEWEIFDSAQFIDSDERPEGAKPLVKNWMYRKTVVLFSSNGGSGKTYITLTFAALAAMGLDWFGEQMVQGRVLYVGAEDELNEIAHRLWGICNFKGINRAKMLENLDLFSMVKVPRKAMYVGDNYGEAEFTKQFDRLKAQLEVGQYDYLILDNLSKFYMANENARPLVDEFVSGLAGLANIHNLAVLLLGHDAKSGSGYSGSTAWHNSARARWSLNINGDTQQRELIVEKNNYGATGHGGQWKWDAEASILATGESIGAAPIGTASAEFQRLAVRDALLSLYRRGCYVSNASRGPRNGLGELMNSPAILECHLDERAVRTHLMRLVDSKELDIEEYSDQHRNKKTRFCPPDPLAGD